MKKVLLLAGTAGAIAALVVGAAVGAFSSSAKSGAPRSDSVKLHGNWTIQVRNPNGRIVSTTRFHNDLTFGGQDFLAKVFARQVTVGGWMSFLSGDACSGAPFCQLVESGDTAIGPESYVFKNLTVAVGTGADVNKAVFRGSAVADQTGSITAVQLLPRQCAPTAPTSPTCYAGGGASVTFRTLPTPIAVVPGQQVLTTVKVSFS